MRVQGQKINARYVCADGFSFSIQASNLHKCEQAEDGTYLSYELGYLSSREPLLDTYTPSCDGDKDVIYLNVPCSVINVVVKKHGGFLKLIE